MEYGRCQDNQLGNKATVSPPALNKKEIGLTAWKIFGKWIARMNGPKNSFFGSIYYIIYRNIRAWAGQTLT
jgi:hypothetical protein